MIQDANAGAIAVTRLKNSLLRANIDAPVTDLAAISYMVAEKQVAMGHVTCDGSNLERFSPQLRNIVSNVSTLTEEDMRRSNGVPLSKDDVIRLDKLAAYKNSMEYMRLVLQGPALTLEQTAGDRTRLAYRLIRMLAKIRGDVKAGDLLLVKLSSWAHVVTKWEMPLPFIPGRGTFRGVRHIVELLNDMNKPHVTYTYGQGEGQGQVYTWGVSYLPVPIPDQDYPDQAPQMLASYRMDRHVPENYDPCEDYGLVAQLFIYEQLAEHLGIGQDNPNEIAALTALLHPKIARLAWPTLDELESFEETVLLPWIKGRMAVYSYDRVIADMMELMHMTYIEAMDMLETGKSFVRYIARYSKEMERSIMFTKLDVLGDDCVADGMISTRLNTMKLRMMAIGLTTPGDDIHEDRQIALSSGLREKIKKHEFQGKEME